MLIIWKIPKSIASHMWSVGHLFETLV